MSETSFTDNAGVVRAGEELNASAIDGFLKQHVSGLHGEPHIKQFPGGASNLTYLLQYPDQEFVLRRPPFGRKAKSAHDMGREYRVMQGLRELYPYVPAMVAFCEDESIIGGEFYVMERLKGVILRGDPPAGLNFSESDQRALCRNMVDRLVELHQADWESTTLKALLKEGDYVERQIDGWCDRYRRAKTDDAPDFEEVMSWLQQHRPKQIRRCLVHNDYRFDNLVLDPDNLMNIIGVLDWEMATIGDPLMDLGNSLAYWVQRDDPAPLHMLRRQPTHLPGMMSRAEIVDYYLQRADLSIPSFDFYEVYGMFRLVVIIQQIYYRFYHGQTQDKRFAGFIQAVQYLDGYLRDKIHASSLS
ncbi:predicted aminoglycoside phosphotransferase [Hahella chejuensis KCTC 2396]|uniref:Predicted aminoglycoside phosphotransferase n=1 Tax=Hahella chejuensis (strain KCTC 2396) TaxID=349521 RepID=Q2S7V5_HAHCH|nr:phosphotransferase family protein [Hahella chejuensis]ABC33269.1 predicted aminoglycoside phosphotransferase [Hahella chejuensis KCTC 2396]